MSNSGRSHGQKAHSSTTDGDSFAGHDAPFRQNGADKPGRLEKLRYRLSLAARIITGLSLDVRPYRPALDPPLATFEAPPGEEEIERYWVNAPFAYVVITYNDEESEHLYNVVEPDLDRFELELLARLQEDIRAPLLYRPEDGTSVEETLIEELTRLIESYGVRLEMRTFHALFYYLIRDFRGYGRIDPLLEDKHIEDISCDGYDLPILSITTRTRI